MQKAVVVPVVIHIGDEHAEANARPKLLLVFEGSRGEPVNGLRNLRVGAIFPGAELQQRRRRQVRDAAAGPGSVKPHDKRDAYPASLCTSRCAYTLSLSLGQTTGSKKMKTSKARLYVFSGAGLSAESGLSTFRTGDGIWTRNSVDEVCNIHTWRQNRLTVFEFYNERLRENNKATPNVAHKLLAQWQRRWGAERVQLLTQNVDDLLEKAGATSVVHLHGDLNSLLCTSCDLVLPKDGPYLDPMAACPICEKHDGVKPGVIFFGECAPAYRHLRRLSAEMRACDLFLCVGTAFEVVPPEAMLPSDRWCEHPGNVLVDPSPCRREMFGVVEAHPATVGLQNLRTKITTLME